MSIDLFTALFGTARRDGELRFFVHAPAVPATGCHCSMPGGRHVACIARAAKTRRGAYIVWRLQGVEVGHPDCLRKMLKASGAVEVEAPTRASVSMPTRTPAALKIAPDPGAE